MKTKKSYTIAEIANLFYLTKTNVDLCQEAYNKFPDDELVAYSLEHAQRTLNELNSLLKKLNAVDIALGYYKGINRTTGNNKLYL